MAYRTTPPQELPQALVNFQALPDDAYVRVLVVALLLGCSTNTVWRRCKNGSLPPAIRLSAGVTGINVGALRRHLADQAAGK